MLARVADNLYWMGRYLERSEHLARFVKIQYFSALDAPYSHKEEMVLRSLLAMSAIEAPEQAPEEEVLYRICLEKDNTLSLCSSVSFARTNARGARDMISAELWENINKFYHYVTSFPAEGLKSRGMYEFLQQVIMQTSIIKGSIENTLLHDEVWAFIKFGVSLERAFQVIRITQTKLEDVARIEHSAPNSEPVENYQISTLLAATEGFDMSRRYYKAPPSRRNALEFLSFNTEFPRSITNCVLHMQEHIQRINPGKQTGKGSVEFMIGKLLSHLQYLTIEEIEADPSAFLDETQETLYRIGEQMNANYLKY
jgi:uncharacterized alpha-E superfamily protein